ncbi:MAG: hypothetical protein LBS55_06310 [Prevotellaceae bacterium]|jgi:hypothetical protein|nr:hypothetical protein [Prevotellaceae bacterium]
MATKISQKITPPVERKLEKEFLTDLKNGFLKGLIDYIKQDETLFLAIRENYINVYYRGGNLLKLELELEPSSGKYKATFNTNYFKGNSNIELPPEFISDSKQISEWINAFPSLKHAMDRHFSKNSKSEREFQQLVARENNYSPVSNATDYFIVDIEYVENDARFDMVAIKWISDVPNRKKTDSCRLALIEMKYGDSALQGFSGIQEHIEDIAKITKEDVEIIKQSAINCFEQLRELDLIRFSKEGNSHQVETLTDEKPEFIFLLANHNPASSILKKELESIPSLENVELKFCTASFMGYGLFDDRMENLADFKLKL